MIQHRQAYGLEPGNAPRSLRKNEEALRWFNQALARRSDFRGALHNKTATLTKARKFSEAFATCERLTIAAMMRWT